MKVFPWIFVALVLASAPARASERCTLGQSKTILARTALGYSASWKVAKTPELFAPYKGDAPAYQNYLAWVAKNTKWDAAEIIRNHVRVGRQFLTGLTASDPFRLEIERGERNLEKILDGRIGRIRAVSCLEALLFLEFHSLVDLTKRAIEFDAFVLEKDGQLVVNADFYRDPESENSGSAGVGESAAGRAVRVKLQKAGWALLYDFHNHPLSFANPYGDLGPIAPSPPDLAAYASVKPRFAIVSDGRETFELPYAQLPLFER